VKIIFAGVLLRISIEGLICVKPRKKDRVYIYELK